MNPVGGHRPLRKTILMTRTIGIIGSGLVGKAVAHLAIAAGYDVVISNSRGPDTISALVQELGPLARAGTVDDVIAAGDIVTLSVPLASFERLPADKFAGKVVLDQTNYYPGMGGFHRTDLDKGELTSSELLQRHLRGAKLVKGLHNLSWIHMESNARPKGDAARTTLPIAGDDAAAKGAVTSFLETIGYHVVDAGSLADSWRIEPGTPIYFWRYAPVVPEGVSGDEAKEIYQQRGEPVSPAEARTLIDEAVRPSPIGGTLEGMPQVHVDLFLEQASADTVRR
ncbi:NADPH-dependent F420 reductase [Inquilinus limosus]|uniref:Oxidoreductase n=1 Tax=Inquilinus limosus TaxID=171674 RepID=A0A211ZUC2_9PROT|nr:NAD(P)-binding domain-containing protein [Inquilinus limosus]OWJ68843.1 oxidoreductase [Inquilinus limosus]